MKRRLQKLAFKLCLLVFSGTQISYAQNDIFELMERTDLKIQDVESRANLYFQKHGTGKGSGYKQYQRWLYERKFHIDEAGNFIRPEKEDKAYYDARIKKSFKTSLTWSELGPQAWTYTSGWNPGVGRITSVAIHPADTTVIYVSSPGGGIWKSMNSGQSWSPLIDHVNSSWMNIFHLYIDPANTEAIYAAVTDGGVIKSTNAGITWSATGTGPEGARQVKINPGNSDLVFCAALNGLWRSTNAGGSWTQVESSAKEDIEFNPYNSDIVYASGSAGSCVWRSTDNGLTWTAITSAEGITHSGRTLLAVSPANPAVVYAVQANGNTFGRLYKSSDTGATYVTTVVGDPNAGTNYFGYEQDGTGTTGQANYDMAICVNPNNADEVHIAGIICWKSLNGGTSFSATTAWSYPNSTGYNHADLHALEWVNHTIYSGSDGGIYKSINQADDWIDLSAGLGIRQFYRISCSKTDPNVITTGAQDNGTSFRKSNGNWVDWLGADGMDNAISPNNAAIAFGTSQNGALYKTTNSGDSKTNLGQPSPGNWVTPLVMNPESHDTLYVGWTGVWRSVNGGTSWTNLSPSITVKMDALAIAPSNTAYIYASQGANLYRTMDGGSSWTTLSAPAFISSIFVSKNNPSKIWISCNSTTNRVYTSSDAGSNFSNLSSGLPALSARSVVVDEDSLETIYVGMNIGVYYRDNVNNIWYEHASGLPLVAVNEVEIQKSGNKLRVATYGRGVWESDLQNIPSPCGTPFALSTTSITTQSAVIGWNTTPGAVSYKVEYKAASESNWTELYASTVQNWATITGLNAGTTYLWRVRTNCSNKNSAYAIDSFTTAASCDPPSGLLTSSISLNSAVISWDVISTALNYTVKYKAATDTTWTQFQTGLNQNWYVLNGLTQSTQYLWEVSSNCPTRSSDFTSTSFITTDPCNPPQNLQTNSISPNSALLLWNSVSGALNYRVEYKKSNFQIWTTYASSVTQNQITLSGLEAATSYDWRVLANCTSLSSTYNIATFTTAAPCVTPLNLTITGSNSSNIRATWDSVSGVISYSLEYKLTSQYDYTSVHGITTPYYDFYTLPAGNYQFRVRGNCNYDSSNYSALVTFAVYCPSYGINSSNNYIDYVSLGNIKRTSGDDNGYFNGTGISTSVNTGGRYSLSVSSKYTGTKKDIFFSVFIDYNRDGDFNDTLELVKNVTTKSQTNTNISFSIPTFASQGSTRMRVILSVDVYEAGCDTAFNGETEDYTLQISTTPGIEILPETENRRTIPLVYPVPANTLIYLKYMSITEDWMEFKLVDMQGRAVLGSRLRGHIGENIIPIDLSSLESGSYLLQTIHAGQLHNQKISILH